MNATKFCGSEEKRCWRTTARLAKRPLPNGFLKRENFLSRSPRLCRRRTWSFRPWTTRAPTKWHLAHVTWFFENFILKPHLEGYRLFDDTFNYCFNSYYESQGPRHPRPKRGLLTRPSAERVLAYRAHVDRRPRNAAVAGGGIVRRRRASDRDRYQPRAAASGTSADRYSGAVCRKARCGRHIRRRRPALDVSEPDPVRWIDYAGGIHRVGHDGEGYCWDNEAAAA